MLNFYRVMHYSAKRGLVIACHLYIFVFNFCTHFHYAKPRPGRGQSLEAEAEAKASTPRPRLRPKFWPRGQLGLENLTSLITALYKSTYLLTYLSVFTKPLTRHDNCYQCRACIDLTLFQAIQLKDNACTICYHNTTVSHDFGPRQLIRVLFTL